MRHNISLDGFSFRLRPVSDSDATFIAELRNNKLLNQFLHPITANLEDQLKWLSDYYRRPNDYYFVIERMDNHHSEGLISIYDINPVKGKGEWGRWILKQNSLAAVESAWLIYRTAFEILKLNEVHSRTIVDNQAVVSFHDSCGISQRHLLKEHYTISGQLFDAIEHVVDKSMWRDISPTLQKLAKFTSRKLKYV